MPNWSYNRMVVYGSKKELDDFQSKLVKAKEIGEELSEYDLYTLYRLFGYTKRQILEPQRGKDLGYIRGNITEISRVTPEKKTDIYTLYIEYESAWSPMIEGFDFLLKTYYETLKEFTCGEEPGCEVYINTDVEHKFFKDKYYLDVEDKDIFYIETDEELIRIFNGLLEEVGVTERVKSVKDIKDYLYRNDDYLVRKTEEYPTSLCEYSPN